VDADLDTLTTALYVKIDELLVHAPQLAPGGPRSASRPCSATPTGHPGRPASPARLHLRDPLAAPRRPPPAPLHARQSGYNKRLRRAAGLLRHAIRAVTTDTGLWTDDVWLAGWAQYGYCASHSRSFWGLRLHLVCTLHGLPVALALTDAKADERQVLLDLLAVEPELVATRPGQTLLADKHYYGREFQQVLAELGARLLRPARKGKPHGPVRSCSSRCGS
jgi:hypothetical protein